MTGRRLLVLPLALTMGLLATAAPVSGTSNSAATGQVVVLGDSYASGEGLPTAEGECGQEASASWGALVAEELEADLRLLACSGATVADLLTGGGDGGQMRAAAADGTADVVLLTIGGNDLGFTDIVADCLGFAELQDSPAADALESGSWTELVSTGEVDRGCDVTPDELLGRIEGLRTPDAFVLDQDGTTGGLADVYVRTAEAVVADEGRLVVVGYPTLFEEPDRWVERYGRRCHGVGAADVTNLNDVVRELDVALATAVATADEQLGGGVVHYVTLSDAYDAGEDDHRLCGAGQPWMNGLTVSEGGIDIGQLLTQLGVGEGGLDLEALGARPSGSFHPGTAGHMGTAEVVLDALSGGS